jgi:hypothetical protein
LEEFGEVSSLPAIQIDGIETGEIFGDCYFSVYLYSDSITASEFVSIHVLDSILSQISIDSEESLDISSLIISFGLDAIDSSFESGTFSSNSNLNVDLTSVSSSFDYGDIDFNLTLDGISLENSQDFGDQTLQYNVDLSGFFENSDFGDLYLDVYIGLESFQEEQYFGSSSLNVIFDCIAIESEAAFGDASPANPISMFGIASDISFGTFRLSSKWKWGVNQTLYIKAKAEKGILERIVIKQVLLNTAYEIPVYKDTYNSLWSEEELILKAEADYLVSLYTPVVQEQSFETDDDLVEKSKWKNGESLYVRAKAERGVLERVIIKRVIYRVNSLYIDFDNTIWSERELILKEEADYLVSLITPSTAVVPRWSVNDSLFVKSKADIGIIQKVSIKRIILNKNPVYVDSYNTLWNEDELISDI